MTHESRGGAAARWRAMVLAEHAQSDRARGPTPPPSDFWQARAGFFRQDPRRPDDPMVERIARGLCPRPAGLRTLTSW